MKAITRCLALTAAVLTGLVASIFPAHSGEAMVRIAYNLPADHATGHYFETLAKEIESRTAATSLKLKARTFPNGQLFNDTSLVDALSTGAVEIGQLNPGFMNTPDAVSLRIWSLPFLYSSWEALWATEDNSTFTGVFQTQLNKHNMSMLGWAPYGTVEFYAKKPIRTPEDIKGMRLRAFGVDTSQYIRLLGGSPVSLSSQEMFQAVQRGVIDGFITGPTSVYSRKLYEAADNGTNLSINYLSFMAVASVKWMESLPADTRAAVVAASGAAQAAARARVKEDDAKARAQLAAVGLKVSPSPTPVEREAWIAAARPQYVQFLEKAGETGAEMMQLIKAANSKYEKP